jgi:hypothetical protein
MTDPILPSVPSVMDQDDSWTIRARKSCGNQIFTAEKKYEEFLTTDDTD